MVKKVGKTSDKGASDDVFDTLVVESKNASTVVLMLQSKEEEVLVKATDALTRYVDKSDENKKTIMDLGTIDHLLNLICHDEKSVRRSAIMTLSNMTSYCLVRRQLKLVDGVIIKLLNLLSADEEPVIHEFSTFCLSHLSKDFTTKAIIVQEGGVELLLRLLSSNDPDIQKNSIDTITQLLQDYQSKIAMRSGIPQVLELIRSEYPVIQTQALVSLQLITQDPENRVIIRDLDGVTKIIDFIGRPDYSELHPYAVAVLANCMDDLQTVQAVKDSGGFQKLIAFITDVPAPDDDSKGDKSKKGGGDKNSRAGKKGGKGEEEAHVSPPPLPMGKVGAPSRMLGTSMSKVSKSTKGVKNAKNAKSKNKQQLNLMRIQSESEIESLTTDDTLSDNEAEDKQRKTDTSEMVIATLPEVKEQATKALARAARNPEARKILHDQEFEKMLMILLMHDDIKVNIAAALGIGVMAEYVPSREVIVTMDGIEPLLKMLKSENEDARQVSAYALAGLNCGSAFVTSEIVRLKGIEILVGGLAEKGRPLTAASCAACLTNACHRNYEHRHLVAGAGAIQALIEPMNSTNTCLQSKACLAVAALCCDVSSREILRENNGIEPIVNMLTSNCDEVRSNASWAITIIACDAPAASDISRYGALNHLIEIQNSVSMKNPVSQSALDKILDNNLSAKYALTAATDTITDDFYDVGKLERGASFRSLEELTKLEINCKRAVILINNKSESQISPTASDNDLNEKHSKSSVSGRNSRSSKEKGSKKDKNSKTKLVDEIESGSEVVTSTTAIAAPEVISGQPIDANLISYYDFIETKVLNLPNSKEQAITIAQLVRYTDSSIVSNTKTGFVAEKMGGIIERGRVASYAWQLHVNELKVEAKSNVINIGNIQRGIHCHRALLYKILSDRCGVACSLDRGEYNRSWNEVLLSNNEMNACGEYNLVSYVVDLVHYPGRLMIKHSAEALTYKQLT